MGGSDLCGKCPPLVVVLGRDLVGGDVAPDPDAEGNQEQYGGHHARDHLHLRGGGAQKCRRSGSAKNETLECHIYPAATDSAAAGSCNSEFMNSSLRKPCMRI